MEDLKNRIFLSFEAERKEIDTKISDLSHLKQLFSSEFGCPTYKFRYGCFYFRTALESIQFSTSAEFEKVKDKLASAESSEILFYEDSQYSGLSALSNRLAAPNISSKRKNTDGVEHRLACSICGLPCTEFFRCLYCDTLSLCEDCDNKHEHPSVAVNMGNKGEFFTKIYFLKKAMEQSIRQLKVTEQPSCLSSTGNIDYKAQLKAYISKFEVDPYEQFLIRFFLKNTGTNGIPAGVKVFPVNMKDINVPVAETDCVLFPGESLEIKINCFSQNTGRYPLRMVATSKEGLIIHNELIVVVLVTETVSYRDKYSILTKNKKNLMREYMAKNRKMTLDEAYKLAKHS